MYASRYGSDFDLVPDELDEDYVRFESSARRVAWRSQQNLRVTTNAAGSVHHADSAAFLGGVALTRTSCNWLVRAANRSEAK